MRKNKSKYVSKARQSKTLKPHWLVKLTDKLNKHGKHSNDR